MVGGTYGRQPRGLDDARGYTIQVQGEVERHWELELRMDLSYSESALGTISILSGRLPDQAALLGALGRLAMWGYVILLVRMEPDGPSDYPDEGW